MMAGILGEGLVLACGAIPLNKGMALPLPEGMPTLDDLMSLVLPNAAAFTDAMVDFKMAVDPNNIAARRWDYETGLCKKLSI